MGTTRRLRMVAVLLLVLVTGAACAGDDNESGDAAMGRADSGAAGEERELATVDESLSVKEARAGGGSTATRLPSVPSSIIKNGDVSVEVERGGVEEAIQEVVRLAARYQGYVVSTTLDDSTTGSGVVIIRIPSDRFELALGAVKDLGDIQRQLVAGQDVTAEFVDLEARLRNWTTQEAVLLRLMDRAQTISSSIRVQAQLQQVQLEIERIRGRLNFLEDQTSLGTLAIAITEAGAASTKDSTVEKAWRDALGLGLALVSGLIVATGVLVPLAILLLIGLLIFRQVKPRFTA
ncbi:MAG: DUF4349 domain-containing protein [Actinomycetota bacterium]|nr:DUF4349 domain-containing protein [Actinomycetota bacterium]